MRIKCLGYKHETQDGYDYDCEYPKVNFSCDECICNGGRYSPQTGKLFRGNPKPYELAAKSAAEIWLEKLHKEREDASKLKRTCS